MSSIARHGNRGQSNYVGRQGRAGSQHRDLGAGVRDVRDPRRRDRARDDRDADDARDEPEGARRAGGRDSLGRIGEPEDIWLALQFILECDYFNGRTIDVDGGLVMT